MATGAPGANGVWLYGEDDSETTFSALLNKAGTTVNTQIGADRTRLTSLEGRATTLEARALAGLVLVKSQAVGSGVSSVTVTDAFSSTYDSYRIIYTGGNANTDNYLNVRVGSANTQYYGALYGHNYNNTTTTAANNNTSSWYFAASGTNTMISCDLIITNPYITSKTLIYSHQVSNTAGRTYTGMLSDFNSYTSFSLTTDTGTMSGGTIYVYGMKK